MPFIERAYRVRAEPRRSEGSPDFSNGEAMERCAFGFAHPELFGSVSAHSAALIAAIRREGVNAGASAGNLAARILTNVFGNSIDPEILGLNSPFLLAKKNSACSRKTKIYFDCGTEDSTASSRGGKRNGPGAQFPENPARKFHLIPGRAQPFPISSRHREPRTNSMARVCTRRTQP